MPRRCATGASLPWQAWCRHCWPTSSSRLSSSNTSGYSERKSEDSASAREKAQSHIGIMLPQEKKQNTNPKNQGKMKRISMIIMALAVAFAAQAAELTGRDIMQKVKRSEERRVGKECR